LGSLGKVGSPSGAMKSGRNRHLCQTRRPAISPAAAWPIIAGKSGAAQPLFHAQDRTSGKGRLEPIDRVRANGRSRCSPL